LLRTLAGFNPNAEWFFKVGETARLERILAAGRAVLAVAACVLAYFDSTQPPENAPVVFGLLLAYAGLSVSFLVWIQWRSVEPTIIPVIHVIDFSILALVSALAAGSNSPLLAFFSFVVLAAAYRWGLRETVITACAFWALFFIETLLVAPEPGSAARGLASSGFAVRSACMALITVMFGYLAGQSRHEKQETSFVARLLQLCLAERDLAATVRSSLKLLTEFYGANSTVLLLQDNSNHRVFRWKYSATEQETSALCRELGADESETYLFRAPAPIWFWRNRRSKTDCRITGLDNGSISRVQFDPPECFLNATPCSSVLAATLLLGDDLAGRLYILEPQAAWSTGRIMRSLMRILNEVGPVVHNIYRWRKVRARVHAIEQARAAREIHDGVIPFFLALELEIETILLRMENDAPSRRQLKRMQYVLRNQSHEARDLMNRIKTPAPAPSELVGILRDLVVKFGHETGIKSRFVCHTDTLLLSGDMCHELIRIVQEALINVRKHTRATSVEVTLNSDAEGLDLTVEDNGPNAESDSNEDDQKSWEPAVIRERVLLLKGTLSVELRANAGVRLIIRIPTLEAQQWWAPDETDMDTYHPVLPKSRR
jgi:signal transduction histidine kinase